MHPADWDRLLRGDLDRLRDSNLLRRRRVIRPLDATNVEWDGRSYVNFTSNNYLGLTHHPRVIEAARAALEQDGTGAGAAALAGGYGPRHASAETALANWKGTEAAVLLPSGYQANLAALQTFSAISERTGTTVRFVIDKLVHASLVDAVRASGAPFRVYTHNKLQKLARLLSDQEANQLQVVVTESVFSMDGDTADLRGLAALKQQRGFLLLLDEAHGSGVYGERGAGYAAECGLQSAVDVSIVTLSKALGCVGGAVCTSRSFCDALINHGRAYIFSTNIPPHVAAAVEAALGVLRDEPQHQQRLRELARRAREQLRSGPFAVAEGDSPIIPVILGDERTALDAADELARNGLLVSAIRPPTVPRGTSRLRITISSQHTDDEVRLIAETIKGLRVV